MRRSPVRTKVPDIFKYLRISSYINNVHPIIHFSFYQVVESLVDSLIPLFDQTLIDLKAPGYQNQRIHLADIRRTPVVDRDPGQFRPPEQRAYKQWINDEGCYHDDIFVDLKREFWNFGLQMVLQMRDINLKADHPDYEGEEWRVQGQNVSQTPQKHVYKLTIRISRTSVSSLLQCTYILPATSRLLPHQRSPSAAGSILKKASLHATAPIGQAHLSYRTSMELKTDPHLSNISEI